MTPRVAVVGGGISGLAAAHRLRALLGPSAEITVVEQTDRLGGKIKTAEVAGRRFDVGAEAYLVRRPEVGALLDELDLADGVVHPTGARSTVRAGGVTRHIPGRHVMGVPADPAALTDLLTPEGLARVAAETDLPPLVLDGDTALGPLLRARFGDELPERLVDPLLGGVYAGGVDGLGLRATLPAIAAALDAGATSLTEAAARSLLTPTGKPVFGTLRDGLGTLVDRLAQSATVRLGAPVRELTRTATGWRLTLGAKAPAHQPPDPVLDVDAVVLAVPAPAARKLLDGVVPVASAAYGRVEVASMAVVALALPEGAELPGTSGVLLGAGERRLDGTRFAVKAFTFSAAKWAHLGGESVIVRGSVGRFGDPGALKADDDELVRLVRADLVELTGVTAPPIDATVTRWGGGLPQYATGHTDLVAEIERAVAAEPGLAVAGATLHGVGVPACVATGDAAARRVADHLREQRAG
ncbi:protoporphyrinogen oxidase [Actinokineospora globicatena]|uniref:protoporphyrinogen oxidase n=1 Tax=Actinokineospora globicatena TaxID=103729 RepID=UPI0020A5EE09|nr:protoporphyrinogen oxidase [Actinokineospora globicatena]MCP2302682.1 oxygen-dependent protoporphyrinogen oxidase [Actinokineospora globicatena]GLW75630.1 protoporphyrinogen oxidase [Actinokineospora globicatena]GLW82470.1 protoporphyrinogen oxidase [Actinokineospora globicatena]